MCVQLLRTAGSLGTRSSLAVCTPSITSSPRSEIVQAFASSVPLPPKPKVRKLSNLRLVSLERDDRQVIGVRIEEAKDAIAKLEES